MKRDWKTSTRLAVTGSSHKAGLAGGSDSPSVLGQFYLVGVVAASLYRSIDKPANERQNTPIKPSVGAGVAPRVLAGGAIRVVRTKYDWAHLRRRDGDTPLRVRLFFGMEARA